MEKVLVIILAAVFVLSLFAAATFGGACRPWGRESSATGSSAVKALMMKRS